MRRRSSSQPAGAPASRARLDITCSTPPTPSHFTALPDVAHAIIASFLCCKDHLHVACCSRQFLPVYRTQTQALTLRRRYYNRDSPKIHDDDDDEEEEEDEEKKEKEAKPVTMEETMETWTKRAALARLLQGACGLRHLRVPDGRDMELVFDAMRRQCLTHLQSLSISRDEPCDQDGELVPTIYMDEERERILSSAMRANALPSLQSLELGISGFGLQHLFNALSAGACPKLSSLSLSHGASKGDADIAAMMQTRAERGRCSALKSLVLNGYGEGRGVVELQQALTSPLCSSLENLGLIRAGYQMPSEEVAAVASWLRSGGAQQLQSLELHFKYGPEADAVIEAIASGGSAAPNLTQLTMQTCRISNAARRTLTEAIQSGRCLTSLTSLDFSKRNDKYRKSPLDLVDGEVTPLIAAVVQHCTRLCDLIIDARVNSNPQGVAGALTRGILDSPSGGTRLRKLNLLYCVGTGVEANLLAAALRVHHGVLHSLTELKLSESDLKSTELIRVLAQRAVLPALRTLNLSHNKMGDEQVKLLFSGAYPSLTTLGLARVGLTGAGAKAIGELLCGDDPSDPSFPQLRDLDLSVIEDTEGVVYMETIARALSGQASVAGTLVKLKLGGCDLSPISARLMADALCNPGAAKLEYLHFGRQESGCNMFINLLIDYANRGGRGLSLRHLMLDTGSYGKVELDQIARLSHGGAASSAATVEGGGTS